MLVAILKINSGTLAIMKRQPKALSATNDQAPRQEKSAKFNK